MRKWTVNILKEKILWDAEPAVLGNDACPSKKDYGNKFALGSLRGFQQTFGKMIGKQGC